MRCIFCRVAYLLFHNRILIRIQGWHLPHLSRSIRCNLIAIIERSVHPTSSLNPSLDARSSLGEKYSCDTYASIDDFLDSDVADKTDGIIVCTPHSTHFDIGAKILTYGIRRVEQDGAKPLQVLMEKPMTTCVDEARKLDNLAKHYEKIGGTFLVNHTANFRQQTKAAREIVRSGKLGRITLVTGLMASPLSWLFDNPDNRGWNEPDESGKMIGNGFAWGQTSHILAWIYHVTDLDPSKVYCTMRHSEKTGADVAHSATIECNGGVTFSLSGTSLLPGYEHADPPIGKQLSIRVFGTNGALTYIGNDRDPGSGHLEFIDGNGKTDVLCEDLGFQFENAEVNGDGPESLQEFLSASCGIKPYDGANSGVGLKTVKTIEAMYRSNVSGNAEGVL